TPDNLRNVLAHIGQVMNPDEDVLFLFLTSHGAPDMFSIDVGPIHADQLYSDDLKDMLDASGIKWRVLVISACYSGSFINEPADDHTCISAAARYDRTSFGCASERNWTYFSEAFFDHALRRDTSFVAAFDEAQAEIANREGAEQLTPSDPQIRVGRAIPPKLAELERTARLMQDATP